MNIQNKKSLEEATKLSRLRVAKDMAKIDAKYENREFFKLDKKKS